ASKDFADVHGLIMHTYSSQNADLRVDHLGLHKALCVLMGWNYLKAPENSKAYQLLSADDAQASREDLIIWPPTVIIHNTSSGRRKDGRIEGMGNREMDNILKGEMTCSYVSIKVTFDVDSVVRMDLHRDLRGEDHEVVTSCEATSHLLHPARDAGDGLGSSRESGAGSPGSPFSSPSSPSLQPGPTTILYFLFIFLGLFSELGFGGGKSKSIYGKEGHTGITMVKFANTQAGMKESERLADYFEKDNHGRKGWARAQACQSGDDDKNPTLVKTDEKTGEKKRVLYGYLATASDLDKIDFDMRKRAVIKSRRELDLSD
ncbi:hypothetical protein BHE74_00030497, partial [Ensete ventricosum]